MLKLRYFTLVLPLAMQMSAMSAGALATDEEEQQVITITTTSDDSEEAKKAVEEKIRDAKAAISAKVERARAEAEKAKAGAEKVKTEAKIIEARIGHPQVLTIVGTAEDSKEQGDQKDGKRITVRGQFKVTSPDGKTFEVVAPDGVKMLHEKLQEMHGGKMPAGAHSLTIIRSKDGEEQKIEADDLNAVIGELTARVKEGGEAPKFIIGVSVSEAPAVVLNQIGKPELAAVVVDSVVEESPAQKAGVKKFDLILKAAGEPVKSPAELTKAVKSADGKEIELILVRTGKELKVSVTPKSNDPSPAKVKVSDGTIQFGPGMMLNRQVAGVPMAMGGMAMGMGPGNLMEEIKGLRKDIEELKKMIEELKAAK